ncbi:MAG: response regulator [Sphingomonadales bacterium]|nr:MAG: response regulator [Sphingomonadales bacterium]
MLPPTLLVVEDDPLVMLSAAAALEDEGWVVKKAANGAVAINRLGDPAEAVDAVVIDITLGDGPSGWDVARFARSVNANIAVAYITGDMNAGFHPEIVDGGVVLCKPFKDSALLEALNRLLDH